MAYPTNKELQEVTRRFISTPLQQKRPFQNIFDAASAANSFETEYEVVGRDLAKPGSDQTSVAVYPGGFQVKPEWLDAWVPASPSDSSQALVAAYNRCKEEINRVAGCPPSILVTKEEAARMMPALPKQSEPDRIWDLIVLAAEASRYG